MPTTKLTTNTKTDNFNFSIQKNDHIKPGQHIFTADSVSNSTPTESNLNRSSIFINSSKKIIKDLFTGSKMETRKFVRSHTMSANERRKAKPNINRSSSRNLIINTEPAPVNLKPPIPVTNKIKNQETSPYDKLFNKIKQPEHIEIYSHIYKDFASDCLKPFFSDLNSCECLVANYDSTKTPNPQLNNDTYSRLNFSKTKFIHHTSNLSDNNNNKPTTSGRTITAKIKDKKRYAFIAQEEDTSLSCSSTSSLSSSFVAKIKSETKFLPDNCDCECEKNMGASESTSLSRSSQKSHESGLISILFK